MKLQPYTKEWLTELCQESFSYAEVLKKAGRSHTAGGNVATLKKKIEEFQIDISHFGGQAWSKGKTKETDSRIASREKYSLEEVFVKNSPVSQKVLRGYVERHNVIEHKCAFCGTNGDWFGTTIVLEIDHIDGDNRNNEISNLRYVCPNCHSLTETYRGRNKALKAQNKCVESIDLLPKSE